MLDVINFTEARNNLKSVLDKVVDDANVTIIARRDAPDAVVMSLDTYNSIMETAYLLKNDAGYFALIGVGTSPAWLAPDAPPPVDESDAGEGELDFEMF